MLGVVVGVVSSYLVWRVGRATGRRARRRLTREDEDGANDLVVALDSDAAIFEDTLTVINPFVIDTAADLSQGASAMRATTKAEQICTPANPTRAAVALAHAVKVKMGVTVPPMTEANRLVASKLAMNIARAHNVRDADICRIVPAAVSLVFLPSRHDIVNQRRFMTRRVGKRYDEYETTYQGSLVEKVKAFFTGDEVGRVRTFRDK
jgi:hypothetical protein